MKLATLCYIQREEEILFLHRNKDSKDFQYNKYVALGGKIKEGESPEQCVKREVEEESGLILQNPTLKGILTFNNSGRTFNMGGSQPNWYVFPYLAKEFSGELHDSSEGDLIWVARSKIDSLNMWEGDRLFFPWIVEKSGYFSANFVYEHEKLISHEEVFYH